MTWSSFKDVALFVLAIYAAVLSTWNLRQALRKDRRTVRVTVGAMIPTYPNGELGKTWANIVATNVGQRPVTVETLALELDTGGRLYTLRRDGELPSIPDTPLPATLADGQSARLVQTYHDIGHALLRSGKTGKIRLTAVCVDSAGTVHKGDHWDADPRELLGM